MFLFINQLIYAEFHHFEITGTLTNIYENQNDVIPSSSIGDMVIIHIIYQDTTDTNLSLEIGDYDQFASSYVKLNGLTFKFADNLNEETDIRVHNKATSDVFSFYLADVTFQDWYLLTFDLVLRDSSGTVFNNDTLKTEFLLESFDHTGFQFEGFDQTTGNQFHLLFEIERITKIANAQTSDIAPVIFTNPLQFGFSYKRNKEVGIKYFPQFGSDPLAGPWSINHVVESIIDMGSYEDITIINPTTMAQSDKHFGRLLLELGSNNNLVTGQPIDTSVLYGDEETTEIFLYNSGNSDVSFSVSPDVAGRFAMPAEALTIPYTWEDISSSGLLSEISDYDDESVRYDLQFDFPFLGGTYSSVFVHPNGYCSFDTDQGIEPLEAYVNRSLPTSSIDTAVLGFWDDLDPSANGYVYILNEPTRFVVQFDQVTHHRDEGESYTFQMILYDSGDVEIKYNSMIGDLESATVGIQKADGSQFLQLAYNEPYVTDNMAIEIDNFQTYTGILGAGESITLAYQVNGASLGTGITTGLFSITEEGLDVSDLAYSIEVPVDGENNGAGDGLPDKWEWDNFQTLQYGPNDDFDEDGLINMDEITIDTDPNDRDTDNDFVSDKSNLIIILIRPIDPYQQI